MGLPSKVPFDEEFFSSLLGELDTAVDVLEEAVQQRHMAFPVTKAVWMDVQLQLAQLYRRRGQIDEAKALEDELRQLLVYAEPDFYILERLNRLVVSR